MKDINYIRPVTFRDGRPSDCKGMQHLPATPVFFKNTIMKHTLLLVAGALFSLFSFAQNNDVIKDANAEKRSITGFHAITISSGIDLYYSQGDEGVAVSAANTEDRERIVTEVSGGVLKIYMKPDSWRWNSHGDRKLRAYVSCRTLDALTASGGSDIYIKDNLSGERLDLNLSGGSDLKGKISVSALSITQSGGSDSYISGAVAKLSVNASGGSDFHGYDLQAEECRVMASGGSDVHLTANKELSVNASGGSDVYYKGAAVVRDQHASGSSSINHKS